MELWIRSQDREILTTAQHLDIYNSSVEGEECYVIEESGTDLGCYETYEKALEVLDKIQKIITSSWIVNGLGEYKAQANTIVYEMPKE